MALTERELILKRSKRKGQFVKDLSYTLLALPAIIWLFFFHYMPVSGIVLAFKEYRFNEGIFGSQWIGFKNFEFFFKSTDALVVLRNTIGYHIIIMFVLNLIGGMIVALMLYEVRSKFANKLYQTSMIIPDFISWIIISYIAYLFLNPEDAGILNQIINFFGGESINWYNEPSYWPFIIIFFQCWRAVGMASLYYYAALLAIDPCLFEAASLDGAGKFRQIWHVSVPELMPMACIVLITQLGGILNSNFDMYYQLPMNSGALYPATDVISTYIYRGLVQGSIGPTAAVGLFQNFVGCILILLTNGLIKKISPENAMF
ncbi:MAG: sugar ABC transporter permease [Clostridia bacterium]|nr:sugar ABC transporter permease [Clostridia bacterium]